MTTSSNRVRKTFADVYRRGPAVAWAAPGRVNLIGEHTDYNDGFVLPFALPHRTAVAGAVAERPEWTVWSESTGETVTFGEDDVVRPLVTGWASYVAGVVWALRDAGIESPGARLAVTSDVPPGAGLSSSAALECAVLAVLLDLAGAVDLVPESRWPAIAQRAENAYVGVPCGIMDQSAATLARDNHALFLDCRTLAHEHVPFAVAEAGLAVLIIDTGAPHRHAGGEYAARRATCEAAARTLGVPALRDVTDLAAAIAALPDETSRRRVRHVVTVAELDTAAEAAEAAGALGARMTGGGFGGCVIALVAAATVDDVSDAVVKAFAMRGFGAPATFVATPAAGVGRVP